MGTTTRRSRRSGRFALRLRDCAIARFPARPSGSADFAHQSEEVVLAVAEESHPELVIGHLGDEVRLIFEFHAAALHLRVGLLEISDLEVEDRSGMVKLRLLRKP